MHDRQQIWHNMRINVGHVSRPQVGERELESATNDDAHVVRRENFQQVVEHGLVLLLGDDDEGHDVNYNAEHSKGQDHVMEHVFCYFLGSLERFE